MEGDKADLHIHTKYSRDATIDVKDLPRMARAKGLRAIAITDHQTMAAFNSMPKLDDVLIIKGVEIETDAGHVLGLFISEVPGERNIEEVIDGIRSQGGISVFAHPFGFPRVRHILSDIRPREKVLVAKRFDAVEAYNSRVLLNWQNRAALHLATMCGKPVIGGSDAHTAEEVGNCYTLFDKISSEEEMYQNIRRGKTWAGGHLSPLKGHVVSCLIKAGNLFEKSLI